MNAKKPMSILRFMKPADVLQVNPVAVVSVPVAAPVKRPLETTTTQNVKPKRPRNNPETTQDVSSLTNGEFAEITQVYMRRISQAHVGKLQATSEQLSNLSGDIARLTANEGIDGTLQPYVLAKRLSELRYQMAQLKRQGVDESNSLLDIAVLFN
jgi:TolA-binding protein